MERRMNGEAAERGAVRVLRPDRAQSLLQPEWLDELIPPDDLARTVWDVSGRLDLAAFEEPIQAREAHPGRPAIQPRLLVALWLYAYMNGVGNGRELDRLCGRHAAYRWLCGGVAVNYHTLNDFRVSHEAALQRLFTDVLAALLHADVVQVERVCQDGTRVRASANRASFRRRASLEACRAQAQAHLAAVTHAAEPSAADTARRQAAQQRAAQERLARVEAALAELPKLEQIKERTRADKPSKRNPPVASTTDPEARRMRLADGGFAPAYNVQIATDPRSRAIVAVDVTNHGTDHGEDAPLRAQIHRATGRRVREHIVDGGYFRRVAVEQAAAEQVALYAPLPATRPDGTVCTRRAEDSPALAAWRARMSSPAGQAVYGLRAPTSETVNADLKTHRGLRAFPVRGLARCRCLALWAALAYNLRHFATIILQTG
jgi:transposase